MVRSCLSHKSFDWSLVLGTAMLLLAGCGKNSRSTPIATRDGGAGAGGNGALIGGQPAPGVIQQDVQFASDNGLEVWSWVIDERRGDPRSVIVSKETPEAMDDDQKRVITRLGLRVVKEDLRLVTLRSEGTVEKASLNGRQLAGLAAIGLRPVALRYSRADELLAPYVDRPVPMDAEAHELWRQAGLRVLSVPVAELRALQASLPLKGQANRQWMGEVSSWTDLVTGIPSNSTMQVMIPGGMLEMPAGRLSLLTRCWATPMLDAATSQPIASLNLELVPQHEERVSSKDRLSRAAGLKPAPATGERGLVLLRLLARATLSGEEALIIIPQGAVSSAPYTPAAALDGGPSLAPVPTLGEAMLGTLGSDASGETGDRVILVLVPKVAKKFELIKR